jgi:hypothetical protein
VTSVDKPGGPDKARERASSRSLKVPNNNNASYSSLGKAPSQSKKFAPLNPIITPASRGEMPPKSKNDRPTKSSSLQPMPRLLPPPRDSPPTSKPKFTLPQLSTLKYPSNTNHAPFTTNDTFTATITKPDLQRIYQPNQETYTKPDSQRNYQSNQETMISSPIVKVDNYLSVKNYQSSKKSAHSHSHSHSQSHSHSHSEGQLDITNITIKEGLGSSLVDHRNRNACLELGGMFKGQADGKVIGETRFFGVGQKLDGVYILCSVGGLFKREDGKTKYFGLGKEQKFFGGSDSENLMSLGVMAET